MNRIFKRKAVRSWIAGTLAAVIVALPLAGCQSKPAEGLLASAENSASSALSSLLRNESSSRSSSSQTSAQPSSKASGASSAPASKAASASAIKPKQNAVPQKLKAAKVETGNQNIRKITADPAAQSGARLAVTQSKPSAAAYSVSAQRSGYNTLTEDGKSLYNQILKSAYQVADQKSSSGYYPTQRIVVQNSRLSEAQLRLVLMAALNDNPQVFWLANAYSYGYSGSQTYIQLYSAVSREECNAMIQRLNQKVDTVVRAMPSGLSELDRELYLSEYLMDHCAYNNEAAADSSLWKAFTSYGALVEGSVVCEGYSRAMQLLASYAGLQCMLVTGQSNNVNHMWNAIRIDDSWYYLDNTWDDNNPTVYNYFNVTEEVLRQTHTIFPLASALTEGQIDGTATGTPSGCNLIIPSCTATAANYFRAKGIRVSGFDGSGDSAAVGSIVAAANKKAPSVSFFVEDGADYEQIFNGMVNTSPYQLMTYLNEANGQKGIQNKIALNSIRYLSDPADRGLTVLLSYQ